MPNRFTGFAGRGGLLIGAFLLILAYAFFISGLATNPPGFYMDESCIAYNGYSIAATGKSEAGVTLPLYIQCFTESSTAYANPLYVYVLAATYLVLPPSITSARITSATVVFFAVLLLGLFARRISGRWLVGGIVALTATLTPWLFEVSRLVFEVCLIPVCLVLFLYLLFNAYRRGKWSLWDNISLAISLALITYAYTSGRLLGPALAFGLLIFGANRHSLINIFKTWAIYSVTLIPLLAVYFSNGDAITKRFNTVTYATPGNPWGTIVSEFFNAVYQDVSLNFFLFSGDPLPRHHVPGMGEILAATFAVGLLGMVLVLLKHRSDPWWRFILYGLVVSILPGVLTVHRSHSLRLLAFPIFFLLLTVPGISWLVDQAKSTSTSVWGQIIARVALASVVVFTIAQAVVFQVSFRELGPKRLHEFDTAYPRVLEAAMAETSRPIYLKDGYWGPGYIHAYWYGAISGIDRSNFVHLRENEIPPDDAIVLSSDLKCTNCKTILHDGSYLLYRKLAPTAQPSVPLSTAAASKLQIQAVFGEVGAGVGQSSQPRGIAIDSDGNVYVADTENARIQKFDGSGQFILSIGSKGDGPGELMQPNGLAIDRYGSLYVTDALNHKLIKFDKDNKFVKEWKGPQVSLYGPRDVSIGPDDRLYFIDQGNTRVVVFDTSKEVFSSWGTAGNGEGQFSGPTGIAVAEKLVFVADAGNNRVQVFDLEGKFVRQWEVSEWDTFLYHFPDLVFDNASRMLFVTSGKSNEILAFDLNGGRVAGGAPAIDGSLDNPSSLLIGSSNKQKRLIVLNTRSSKVVAYSVDQKKDK